MTQDISFADWTSDGARLAVVRSKGGLQQLEFPTGHVLFQSTGGIQSPRISPRGDLIAFVDAPLGFGWVGSLATVDLQGHKKTLAGLWLRLINGLAWSPSGDEILFSAAPFGFTSSLYAVNRSGRQRVVEHLPGGFELLDIGPDSRVLFLRAVLSMSLLYQRDASSHAADLYWHDYSQIADISRDGKTLLFSEGGDSDRTGEDYVSYIRHSDGSPAIRLGRGFPLSLSPDGKWAVVLGSVEAPSQLVVLPTGAGEARQMSHDAIHHQGAAWTPDGNRIVFVGNEPGHGMRYYTQAVDGGPPKPITPENVAFNVSDPVTISPDGKLVAVNSADGKVLLQPLEGGAPRSIPKLEDGAERLGWCPDGRQFLSIILEKYQ
jgi:eukaryotic-like serine/threonine-protein kinase